jgi:hypothetical protein
MQPKQLIAAGIATVIVCCSLLMACRKNDLAIQPYQPNPAIAQFFTLPNATQPAVARIAQKLQHLHQQTGFINTLIEKDGFALWDKALLNLPIRRSGRNTATTSSGDTVVYIPLVAPNTQYVTAFIYARLGDSIQLGLYRGGEYASYGFGSIQDSTDNAERLALQLMVLNQRVFGHTHFQLNDSRLFNDRSPSLGNSKRMLQISTTEGQNPTPIAGRSGQWENITVTVCITTAQYHCTHTGSCASGTCDECYLCKETSTSCETVVHYYFVPDDDDGFDNGINPWGGGGSGGGIFNPNGPQPCNPTPLLDNGLLPCELGNNTGWGLFEPIAINEVDYSEISDSCLRSLIQQFNLPKHKSYIFNTYNQYQATNTAQHLYKVKYLQDTTLVGDNGLPIPGRSNTVKLADGTNYVTVRLNPLLFSNSSKEWAATIILHELSHGIISVIRPQDSTGLLQHKAMFDRGIPISIYQGLKELFPSIVDSDGLALGMDGLSQAYMVDDPNNPNGPQIISPIKDNLAQTVYYQSIDMAILIARAYRNRTLGTPYCQ